MAKKSARKSLSKQMIFNICVSAAVVILGCIVFFSLISINDIFRSEANAQISQGVRATRDQYKMNFCYDRSIRPCDDISLREWNAAHPDDDFVFQNNPLY